MKYEVIATGSSGNATIINDTILIDCGVSFKMLAPYIKQIQIVFISHSHCDHFNKATIRKLSQERPTLRFAVAEYLVADLKALGVKNIDVLQTGQIYDYRAFKVSTFKLYHDVENVGYRLYIGKQKVFYATDTATLDGVVAKGYDYYFVEANHCEIQLAEIVAEKQARGEYAHEMKSKYNHLSIQQAENWLMENANTRSKIIYMHQSKSFLERGK